MNDFRNMVMGLKNPFSFYLFLKILISTFFRVVTVRMFRGLMIQYPSSFRYLAKKIPNFKEPKIKNVDKNISPVELKLAIGSIFFNKDFDWKINFSSHEQFVSLHRWNWLLRGNLATKEDYKRGLQLVRSWLCEMGTLPRGVASESYTVGERISNLCLFTRQMNGNWDSIPLDIADAIKYKIKFLSKRLEFIPGNLTGNHIINNARALILSGHACKVDAATILGREILKDYLTTLIDKYGFLREGSSHYQFLITRWLCEIRLVAEEKNDLETIEAIKEHLPNMIEACRFFLVENNQKKSNMALFGDISPDCEPNWLIDIHRSRLATFKNHEDKSTKAHGWAYLFQDFKSNQQISWKENNKYNVQWFENNINGWYKLSFLDWIAIWHIEDPSGNAIASHAHHDSGSLVLFKSGEEVLIDPGRFEYEKDSISNYGLSAFAHSTITVNNFPIMMSKRDHRIHKRYRDVLISVDCNIAKNKCKVIMRHNGLRRIPGDVKFHTREFNFTENELKISDFIDGSGSVNLKSSFQMPSNQNEYQISMLNDDQNSQKTIESNIFGGHNPIGGWRFKSFGVKEKSSTKIIEIQANLPHKQSFIIKNKIY